MNEASGVVYAAAAAERKRPSLGDRVRPVARAWKPLTVAGVALLVIVTAAGLLLVAVAVSWRVSTNVAAPVFLALAVGGEKLIYLISSSLVGRDRPPVPTVGTTYATSSFPSGHVASAITLYGSIALLIALRRSASVRAALLAVVALIALVVAVCRMYCGFHYLTDCVAGALVGAVWLGVVYQTVLLPGEDAALQLHGLGGSVAGYEPTARGARS